LTVVDKVKEEEMSGEKGLPNEIDKQEIGEVELALSVLPITERLYFIEQIDLDGL
jgi:hypothetical protein